MDVIGWIHARTSYETDLCRDTKTRMGLDARCTMHVYNCVFLILAISFFFDPIAFPRFTELDAMV